MAYRTKSFTECVELAEHYLAIGEATIWLHDDAADDVPWHLITSVEGGALHRLSAPASATVIAEHESGLRFRWSFDFEDAEANGSGQHRFSFERMVGAALRMSDGARAQFADFLMREVEPALVEREREIQGALLRERESLVILRSIASAVGQKASVQKMEG